VPDKNGVSVRLGKNRTAPPLSPVRYDPAFASEQTVPPAPGRGRPMRSRGDRIGMHSIQTALSDAALAIGMPLSAMSALTHIADSRRRREQSPGRQH
jgi:hypothetical protein